MAGLSALPHSFLFRDTPNLTQPTVIRSTIGEHSVIISQPKQRGPTYAIVLKMKQLLNPLVMYLLAFAATPMADAFLPLPSSYARHSRHVALAHPNVKSPPHNLVTAAFSSNGSNRQPYLKQSPSDVDTDASSTINISIFSNKERNDVFQTALLDHPFRKMTGVSLSIDYILTSTGSSSWSKSELDILQHTDIACFSTASSVKRYLKKLDKHLNVDPDISQEERRKLPNKPDLIADILQSVGEGGGSLMAACPSIEIARECLNCGRWQANHIYYPKDGNAVELKTESFPEEEEDEESEDVEEDFNIDVDVWASSVMQAAGDVLERKFWGGGW